MSGDARNTNKCKVGPVPRSSRLSPEAVSCSAQNISKDSWLARESECLSEQNFSFLQEEFFVSPLADITFSGLSYVCLEPILLIHLDFPMTLHFPYGFYGTELLWEGATEELQLP